MHIVSKNVQNYPAKLSIHMIYHSKNNRMLGIRFGIKKVHIVYVWLCVGIYQKIQIFCIHVDSSSWQIGKFLLLLNSSERVFLSNDV